LIEIKIPSWHQHSVAHVMLFLKKHYAKHYDTAKQLITESPDGIEVEIRSLRKSRSRQQENYYRKWCRAFAKHTGLTEGEMHEELLCICYGSENTDTMFANRNTNQGGGRHGLPCPPIGERNDIVGGRDERKKYSF
jgi:hypothetical protein